jgi:hypothetical protein
MNIKAYRKKTSKANGAIGAGTFYFIDLENTCYEAHELNEQQFNFQKADVLCVSQEDALAFEGLPAESLTGLWFPQMSGNDWSRKARELGFDYSGAAMDVLVAQKARKEGYKAIQYGDIQLQVVA